jgi:hypothetical protein
MPLGRHSRVRRNYIDVFLEAYTVPNGSGQSIILGSENAGLNAHTLKESEYLDRLSYEQLLNNRVISSTPVESAVG